MLALITPFLYTLLQAGGGGGFSGGGSGGGFGGGGGGGDSLSGWMIYYLLRLVIEFPLVGIPTLILVLFLFWRSAQQAKALQEGKMIRRAQKKLERYEKHVSWEDFEARDPDFDRAAFLDRVKIAFHKAQEGWCAQDITALRPFVSDGVFERFSVQIEEQKLEGWQQTMEGLSLGTPSFLQVLPGTTFDTITVRLPFRAVIARQALATGDRIGGSVIKKRNFSECWTFVRRPGVQTRAGPGLIEGQCPNCGAPLSHNQSAKCDACGSLARSGDFDWVLTEITQASVWKYETNHEVRGLASFMEHDPGISVQLLEDRASVAFWRKAAADRRSSIEPLLSVATAELCEEYQEGFSDPDDRVMTECAVGSVQLLGMLPGEKQDHALVEVYWDGVPTSRSGADLSLGKRLLYRSLLVFVRRSGVKTSHTHSLTTAHCTECGARDEGGTASTCSFCDAPRRGNKTVWLLEEFTSKHSKSGIEWMARLPQTTRFETHPTPARETALPTQPPRDLVLWAAALAQADHTLDEREQQALTDLAQRAGIDKRELQALLDQDGKAPAPLEPSNPQQARFMLQELLLIAWSDGNLSRPERQLLARASEHLGLTPAEFRIALAQARKQRYQLSKRAVAAASQFEGL